MQIGEIGDHDVRPLRLELGRLVCAADADHQAKAAGASRLHAADRVFKDDGALRIDAEELGRLDEQVRRRLALQAEARDVVAVEADVEQIHQAGDLEHRARIAARRYQRRADAPIAQPPDERNGAVEDLDPILMQALVEILVLPIAEPTDRLAVGRVGRLAFRQGYAAGLQEALDAVVARLAVDITPVVAFAIERAQWLPRFRGALTEVLVEEALPACGVHPGGPCDDPIEVEDGGGEILHAHARIGARHALLPRRPRGWRLGRRPIPLRDGNRRAAPW